MPTGSALFNPLVTLGLPVFNGAQFVEEALRDLLSQTYPRLEILVSDNASTDGTEAICRRLAAADPRVRYVRQTENIGSSRNFEFLAREARGELFAWCAHDDRRLPSYVEECVRELARRPEAVLCNSAVTFLDEKGRPLRKWPDRNFETRHQDRPQRAERLIDHVNWVDMYGLIRRDLLLRALPIEPVWGGDVVLSMKLLMMGHFAKVPAPLFQYRGWVRPRSPEKVMEAVTGRPRAIPHPYTEMIVALFRAAIAAAGGRAEQVEMLKRFLRTLTETEPRGLPLFCWRELLTREHQPQLGDTLCRETFPRHLLEWLSVALPGPAEESLGRGLQLALEGVGRVLVAAGGGQEDALKLPGVLSAIRRRMPNAICGVLWPVPSQAPCPELPDLAVLPYVPLPHAFAEPRFGLDPDVLLAKRWGPDLVICLSAHRTRRLDRVATGSGALLGVAVSQPETALPAGWSQRTALYRPDRRWGFVLPPGSGLPGLEAFLGGEMPLGCVRN